MEYVKTINGKAVKDEEAREEIDKLKPIYDEATESIKEASHRELVKPAGDICNITFQDDDSVFFEIYGDVASHFTQDTLIHIGDKRKPCRVHYDATFDGRVTTIYSDKLQEFTAEIDDSVFIGNVTVTEIFGVTIKDKEAREQANKVKEKLAEVEAGVATMSKFKWYYHEVILPEITGEYENGEPLYLVFLSDSGTPATTARALKGYFEDRLASLSYPNVHHLCVEPEVLADGRERPRKVQYVHIDNTKIEIGAVAYEDGFVKFVMDATLDTPLTDKVTEL